MTPHDKFILNQALDYLKMGFSVIPLTTSKIPHKDFSLETYLYKKPTEKQVTEWFSGEFTGSNIGLCMAPSGKAVLDLDLYRMDDDEKQGARELFKGIITPTASSPRGGVHYYFNDHPDLISKSGILKGFPNIDCKTRGGYICAPPSTNGKGKAYQWLKNKHIAMISAIDIPKNILLLINKVYIGNIERVGDIEGQTGTYGDKIKKGNRDDALFHIANSLVKGGMVTEEVAKIVSIIGLHGCDPPFPKKEISTKIQSALKRVERQTTSVHAEVEKLIMATSGDITTTNVHQWLQMATRNEKQACNKALIRLEKDGLLRRHGNKAGQYKIISGQIKELGWKEAEGKEYPVVLPLGLHEAVRLDPSSVVLFAGVTNTGKTAISMNIAALNQSNYNVFYYTSEIIADAFKDRAVAHDRNWKDWNVKLRQIENPLDIQDIIMPDDFNIIDYLEPPQGDYTLMATIISNIQNMLNKGIAVVCVQKKPNEDHAAGGQYMMNKPHLSCNLDLIEYPTCKITIKKCKVTHKDYINPGGKSIEYHVGNDGVRIIPHDRFEFEKRTHRQESIPF